ncbi:MAG TPA: zinc ribbon domain-containing protein [Gammaproteobacteria bacterium]|nr:zinc ribbon domain-containing protein [Gammaproteobacteria bacterium]
MPIYEFRCAKCGHEFESLQKMSDPDPETCPECGAAGSVSRLISAAAFRLKGGGWYETDFKGKNRRNVAGEGESKPAADTSKPDKGGKKADTPASGAKKSASGGEAA